MKKIKFLLVIALVLCLPFMVNAEEKKGKEDTKKINVYLFRGEGCPHCKEAEEWFAELDKDEEYSKYYKVVDFEVWYDTDNAKFMETVADKLGTKADGVPFIVIGSKYYSGFAESMKDSIKSDIKDAYEDKKYEDVVSKIKDGTYKTKKEKKESSTILPIVIVSVVAIGTIIALIFFTKEK